MDKYLIDVRLEINKFIILIIDTNKRGSSYIRTRDFLDCKQNIDENGILLGAMDDEDASWALSLLSNGRLEEVNSGHSVHMEDPDVFIKTVIDLANDLLETGKLVEFLWKR